MESLSERYESEALSQLRVTYVIFRESISPRELLCFRGAMIQLSGGNMLFHNHEKEGYFYRYPRVQYKLINGRAALIGINEGASALADMFKGREHMVCTLGFREVDFHIDYLGEMLCGIEVGEEFYRYEISNWLPLNKRNFREFNRADGLASQILLLEKILTGNILSMAKGLKIDLRQRIICKIENLETNTASTYKGVGLMSFRATFRCNATLPQWFGLGKSASMNHGTITIL